jgi:hypothetical protein
MGTQQYELHKILIKNKSKKISFVLLNLLASCVNNYFRTDND